MADVYDDSDPFGDGLTGGGGGGAQIAAPGVNPMFDGQVLQITSGYLLKKSPNRVRLNRWQKRWFVMDGETLSWWERSEHEATKEPLGSCLMAEAIIASDSSPQVSAEIVLKIANRAGDGVRDLFLKADTVEEKKMWTEALTKAAGGTKVDSVERLEIMSESTDMDFEREPGDFEIPFASIEWGTHIGKGLCSETKEGTLPDVDVPLAVKTLHNFDTSDQLFAEFSRWTAALGCDALRCASMPSCRCCGDVPNSARSYLALTRWICCPEKCDSTKMCCGLWAHVRHHRICAWCMRGTCPRLWLCMRHGQI
jgi:hypothetical protein|eukprot:COSAG06_NODE_55_length_27705_cov_7.023402_5_plen_310_part_00